MTDLKNQTLKASEILVVDGGSLDNTVKQFKKAGAQVVQCLEKGRGNQLHAGLEKATGDYVVVLHADKRLNECVLEKVAQSFLQNPSLVGGVVGAHFDSAVSKYKIIEFLNNLRFAICGISFGDQVQFLEEM